MIVKTNSWHYRFNFWKTDRSRIMKHNTLCSYFWFTAWNMFWVLFWSVVPVAVLWLIGFVSVSDSVSPLVSWWRNNPDGLWQMVTYPLLGAGIIMAFVVACVTFVYTTKGIGILWAKAFGKGRKDKPTKPKKEPGLLGSYLKARKEKFCPVIKFEE